LSGTWPHIQYSAITVFNSTLPRDVRGREVAATHDLSLFQGRFLQTANMFLGNYQHVRRSLGVDVFKGKGVLVFVDFLRRYFAANDATEQAIVHKNLQCRVAPTAQ